MSTIDKAKISERLPAKDGHPNHWSTPTTWYMIVNFRTKVQSINFCNTANCWLSLCTSWSCPHIEIKRKQYSFKTILKLFCFSFVSMCGQLKS